MCYIIECIVLWLFDSGGGSRKGGGRNGRRRRQGSRSGNVAPPHPPTLRLCFVLLMIHWLVSEGEKVLWVFVFRFSVFCEKNWKQRMRRNRRETKMFSCGWNAIIKLFLLSSSSTVAVLHSHSHIIWTGRGWGGEEIFRFHCPLSSSIASSVPLASSTPY